jgi:hypothetical protein
MNGLATVLLIYGVICGPICAAIAHNKGRSVWGWFFIGFFFSVVGVVLSLISSNIEHQEYQWKRQDDENRRLREQLRQERLRADSMREYTMRRLDMHDQVLGLDTRTMPMLESQPQVAGFLPPGEGGNAEAVKPKSNEWYFALHGETRGPVPPETIQSMMKEGQITGTTLLWADHLPDWRPAALVNEFEHEGGNNKPENNQPDNHQPPATP